MIDWAALDEIEAGNNGWRSAFPELSTNYVPGEGDNPEAFIIGEAPGATEDVQRRPFVGAAGVVLRQLMALANLSADSEGLLEPNCWLTNVVKFRPPKNRNPTPSEVKAARPWLMKEWEAVGSPKLIIPVGGSALKAVTGRQHTSILRAAGKNHDYRSAYTGQILHIWPMVHPSFGLRNPTVQPLLEKDWEALGVWRTRGGAR